MQILFTKWWYIWVDKKDHTNRPWMQSGDGFLYNQNRVNVCSCHSRNDDSVHIGWENRWNVHWSVVQWCRDNIGQKVKMMRQTERERETSCRSNLTFSGSTNANYLTSKLEEKLIIPTLWGRPKNVFVPSFTNRLAKPDIRPKVAGICYLFRVVVITHILFTKNTVGLFSIH